MAGKPQRRRRYIPLDLWEKILLSDELEVKDLSRLKSVCRDWNDLITSSRFVKQHLKFGKKHRKILEASPLLATFDCNAAYCGGGGDGAEAGERVKSIPYPQQYPDYNLKIVGSSDGLVCLCGSSFGHKTLTFFVWNPCTREVMNLSGPELPFLAISDRVFYGFCRDTNSPSPGGISFSFKLVLGVLDRVLSSRILYSLNSADGGGGQGSQNWRRIVQEEPIVGVYRHMGTFFNGNLHWPAMEKRTRPVVVSYDCCREKISKLSLSRVLKPLVSGPGVTLGVLDGCLSILVSSRRGEFTVLKMKQYGDENSWTNFMVIRGLELYYTSLRPLGFMKDGDLLLNPEDEALVKYDTKSNTGVRFKRGVHAIDYVESLVSPKLIVFN